MTETIRYSPILLEDLALGIGSKQIELADRRVVSLSEINLDAISAFQASLSTDAFPYKVQHDQYFGLIGYKTFPEAIAAIGSEDRTLYVTRATAIDANITVPANVRLVLFMSGQFIPASGVTLTIYSPEQIVATAAQHIFDTSAGSVVFTKPGTVYVEWFGAAQDNSTDDTVAFTKAIASNSGTLVLQGNGSKYYVTDEFTVSALKEIRGVNAPTIRQGGTNKRIFTATNPTDLTITGLHLQGEGTGAALADTGLIDINGGTRVRITDNEVYDGRNGIVAFTVTDLWIERNHVHDFRKQGIVAGKSVNFHVDSNVIHGCDEVAGNGVYGIHATGDQDGGDTQTRNSVSFNHIYDIKAWDGFMTHDVDGLQIIGNDIRDVRNGIDIGHLASTHVVKNIIIANNHIESTTTDTWAASNAVCSGIAIVGYDSTHLVEGVTISGNVIKGFGAFNQATGAGGVWTSNSSNVVITGNTIRETHTVAAGEATGGVFVNGTVKALSIMGNTITDAASNPALFGVNFYNATVDQVAITGNTFRNDAAGMSLCIATKNSTALTGMSLGVNASNLSVNSYFSLGGGTTVTWNPGSILVGSATLDFSAPGAVPGVVDATVTVSGAVAGDKAIVTTPAAYGAGFILDAFGSAADTVTVRWAQLSGAAADPDGAGGTYSVKVMK